MAKNENYIEEHPEKGWLYCGQVTQNIQGMEAAQMLFKWSMNTKKYYSALKNEIMKLIGKWMELEKKTNPKEVNQTPKDKYYKFSLICGC